ncbi:uncharacterized protein LOC134822272 [Bolinopsis microptera]|uniref:uncharacterized protein LOC134822272 n=1 Tax=Bolinopsis microptera TaxID=2820187 RepID=UPI00307A713E
MFTVNKTSLSVPLPLLSLSSTYILISYLVATVILGIACNCAILHGLVFRDALKQDRISRVLTTNFAITDILITLSLNLPVLVTVVNKGWDLGPVLCSFTHYFYQVLVINKLWVMVIVSAYRVWMVRQPASVREIIEKKPWVKICGGVAAGSGVVVVILEGVSARNNVFFDPNRLSCYGGNFYGERALYSLLVLTPFYLAPIVMTLELLLQLLIIITVQARAARIRDCQLLNEKQGRRLLIGSALRILVVSAHCLPMISMFADYVHYGRRRQRVVTDGDGHDSVLQALGWTFVLLPLNCTSPLIYLTVNQQFRDYISDISEETVGWVHEVMGRVTRNRDFHFHFPFHRLNSANASASDDLQPDCADVAKL